MGFDFKLVLSKSASIGHSTMGEELLAVLLKPGQPGLSLERPYYFRRPWDAILM